MRIPTLAERRTELLKDVPKSKQKRAQVDPSPPIAGGSISVPATGTTTINTRS